MIDQTAIAKVRRSQQQRARAVSGTNAQNLIGHRLRLLGFRCVARIETGWRVKWQNGRVVGASPMAAVAADWTAVGYGGRSVLVEAKKRGGDRNLAYSMLEPHQHARLTEHAEAGGLSLVGWVSGASVVIFDWSRVRLKPGGSITLEEAMMYDIGRPA